MNTNAETIVKLKTINRIKISTIVGKEYSKDISFRLPKRLGNEIKLRIDYTIVPDELYVYIRGITEI